MKKIIYAVSRGEYSDYSVVALFSTKKLAQAFIDSFNSKNSYDSFNKIEEYQVDPWAKELKKDLKPYFVRMRQDGFAVSVEHEDSCYGFSGELDHLRFDIDKNLIAHVYAKDTKHAIKIVNDRRAQIIAENNWGKS